MDQNSTKMIKVRCPECENEFEIPADVEIGDRGECPFCGMTYEVVSLDPVTIESVSLDK